MMPQCSEGIFYHGDKHPSEVQQYQLPQLNLRGLSANKATPSRFFDFYFILLFVISALVIMQLLFLHETGSNNPSRISTDLGNIPFHPHYTIKDILGLSFLIPPPFISVQISPDLLGDPDSYTSANPFNTSHTSAEWYFLFPKVPAYTVRADGQIRR